MNFEIGDLIIVYFYTALPKCGIYVGLGPNGMCRLYADSAVYAFDRTYRVDVLSKLCQVL